MVFLLLRARFLVRHVPLKRYRHRFFIPQPEHQTELQFSGKELRRFRKIVKFIPVKTTCLMQNIALQDYFKKKNVPFPIYLGLKKDEEGQLLAHAWNPLTRMEPVSYHKIN